MLRSQYLPLYIIPCCNKKQHFFCNHTKFIVRVYKKRQKKEERKKWKKSSRCFFLTWQPPPPILSYHLNYHLSRRPLDPFLLCFKLKDWDIVAVPVLHNNLFQYFGEMMNARYSERHCKSRDYCSVYNSYEHKICEYIVMHCVSNSNPSPPLPLPPLPSLF